MTLSKPLGGLMLLLLLPAGAAAGEPEDVIDYRKAVMTAIKGHNAAAKDIIRGKVAFQGHLAAHADALVALLVELDHLFPQGSDFGETDALPAIWERPGDFADRVDEAQAAADALARAADAGDLEAAGKAYRQLGEACKSCHKSYRRKSD